MKASSSPPSLRTMFRRLNTVPKISFASSSFFCFDLFRAAADGGATTSEATGGDVTEEACGAGCCDCGRDVDGLVRLLDAGGGGVNHDFEYMHSAVVVG